MGRFWEKFKGHLDNYEDNPYDAPIKPILKIDSGKSYVNRFTMEINDKVIYFDKEDAKLMAGFLMEVYRWNDNKE